NASINNSVERAKARLGTNAILPLESNATTLAFSTAFNQKLRSSDFELIKQKTRHWVETNIQLAEDRAIAPGDVTAKKLMEDTYWWYSQHFARTPRVVLRDTNMRIGHSLEAAHGGDPAMQDVLVKEIVFAPIDAPLHCVHFCFSADDKAYRKKEIGVEDEEGAPVDAKFLPTFHREIEDGKVIDYHGYLAVFRLPLVPKQSSGKPKRYTLTYRTILVDALQPLRLGKNLDIEPDEFSHDITVEGEHNLVELILATPREFQFKAEARYRRTSDGPWQLCDRASPVSSGWKAQLPQ